MTTHNRRSFLARLVGGAAALVGIKAAPRAANSFANNPAPPLQAPPPNDYPTLADCIAKGAVTPEKRAARGRMFALSGVGEFIVPTDCLLVRAALGGGVPALGANGWTVSVHNLTIDKHAAAGPALTGYWSEPVDLRFSAGDLLRVSLEGKGEAPNCSLMFVTT